MVYFKIYKFDVTCLLSKFFLNFIITWTRFIVSYCINRTMNRSLITKTIEITNLQVCKFRTINF